MIGRIEAKIKAIEQDIIAIKDGEMLAIHNEPIDKKRDEAQAIELQEWRIVHLKLMKDMPVRALENNLERLQREKQTFESVVLIDLYRIALGVL